MKYTSVDGLRQYLLVADTQNTTYESQRNRRLGDFLNQAEQEAEKYLGYQYNLIDNIWEYQDYTIQYQSVFDTLHPYWSLSRTGAYSAQPQITVQNSAGNYRSIQISNQTSSGTGTLTANISQYIPYVSTRSHFVEFTTKNCNSGLVQILYYRADKSFISIQDCGFNAQNPLKGYKYALTIPANTAFIQVQIFLDSNTTSNNTQIIDLRLYDQNTSQSIPRPFEGIIYQIVEAVYQNSSAFSSTQTGQTSVVNRDYRFNYATFGLLDQYALKPAKQYAGAK